MTSVSAAPLTAEDEAAIKDRHRPERYGAEVNCISEPGVPWPCDAARLLLSFAAVEQRILATTDGPRVRCSTCGTELLGQGWLEHHDDGSHTFTPAALTPLAPEVPPASPHTCTVCGNVHWYRSDPTGTRTPEPPDSASGTVAPWTGEYLPPILDQSQHEDRQVEPPARRIRPQGTITHQHNGWHDHPLVDLGDATAATEPHVHRRRAEPPDSGDGAAPVDLDRLAFALWEEFGGGQLDENDDRPPERLGPEHEYWPAAANRVLGTVRNINANIVRNIAAIAAIRSGSPAPEGGE